MGTLVLHCILAVVVAANSEPKFEFNILEIKTPQLVGIIAGCIVFTLTIGSVIYLLFSSGSWSRFVSELQSGEPLVLPAEMSGKSKVSALKTRPKLYDNLVEASNSLPVVIADLKLESSRLTVRSIQLSKEKARKSAKKVSTDVGNRAIDTDTEELFLASNGSPQYNESAYDVSRLWMWHQECTVAEDGSKSAGAALPSSTATATATTATAAATEDPVAEALALSAKDVIATPVSSKESFQQFIEAGCHSQSAGAGVAAQPSRLYANLSHFCIVDKEFGRPVGMISAVNNSPANLTVQLENIWVTPAYQKKRFAHEAVFLMLQHLFELGYRRVTAEVDTRHIIGKKFLERCGFRLECTLRKHKIVQQRNRDSCVYAMLNSEWPEVERMLRKLLDIPVPKVESHSIAEIATTEEVMHDIKVQQQRKVKSKEVTAEDKEKTAGDAPVTKTVRKRKPRKE